jgi:ankyrin repeat protein
MALLTHCGSETEVLLNQDTTPLYLASQRGFADIVDTLLVTGQSNIDYVMPAGKLKGEMQVYGEEKANYYKSKNNEVGNGATALHAAVENGHLAAVRVLLGHNAKQLPSMQGASPLLIALQYRHPRIAMALLSKNRTAHVNLATAHDGLVPLYVACKYSYHKVVERMLQRGAQIDKALHGKEFAILDVVHSKRVMAVLNKHMARKP